MSVGTTSIAGEKYTIGVAYVAIPSDIDRAVYLRDCYRYFRISIITEDGGFHNRIPINPSELNFIDFPLTATELGTPVVYAVDELMQHPYIITRFARKEEIGDMKEHQFKFRRILDGALVEISGSSKDRTLNLMVNGGELSSKLNVNVFSDNNNSELNIEVAGNVNVKSANAVKIKQVSSFELTTDDGENSSSFVQNSNENKFVSERLIINEGTEPFVLGNQLAKLLSQFIDTVSTIKTIDQKPLSPDSMAKLMNLKTGINSVLSKVGYLDK